MSNLHVRDGISSVQPPLSQAVGYVVVAVIGVVIALGKYSYPLILRSKLIVASHDAHHQGVEENHRRR
jgi:hypothetical protein